jgi:tetratricopeptide (TPR) repeat protein
VEIPVANLKGIEELYDKGLMLQAFEAGKRFGGLREWEGPEAQCMAARLATYLGAPRLTPVLIMGAYRKYPRHPRVVFQYAYTLLRLRGTLEAWEFVERQGELETDDPVTQADWLALRAFVAALFRDFTRAEVFMARAEELAPDHPWVFVERSDLQQREDRYEEALASARRALERNPWYRPGVQACSHALRLLDRHEEACDFLAEADRNMECCWVTSQLAGLQLHLDQDREVAASLDRFVELAPLMDKDSARWLASMRSRVEYRFGNYAAAADQAEKAGGKYFRALAVNLRKSEGQGVRKVLPVRFVRQHHVTCAPATLTVIARFWKMPAEHLEVAEQICYDGSSAYSQRRWAEGNGWTAREFDVSWDATVALIDRGLPFTLTLTAPDNAHLQAVVGYDTRKRVLVVRDPYVPDLSEPLAEKMFEDLKSMGPRGMALVPAEFADRLEGLELPGAGLYDIANEVSGALERYDWPSAWSAYERLAASAPDDHLTINARRAIAGYDADNTAMLEAAEKLSALYPECRMAKLWRITCLRDLGRRDERLALLAEECGRHDSDPGFWWRYADDLRVDGRTHRRALRFLRKSARATGGNRPYHVLADLLWSMGDYDGALEHYRIATCLDDTDEHNAMAYFRAARRVKRTEEGLDLLRARFARFGRKSSGPAISLGAAFEELERIPEAVKAVERGLSLRPDDGYLMLNMSGVQARSGNKAQAARFLEAAKEKVTRAAWLQNAAAQASGNGDSELANEYWHELLEIQPLNIEAHGAIAELLYEMAGEERALAHIEAYAERFPHSYAIHQLLVEWARGTGAGEHEAVVRRLLEINPSDGWALRELCIALQKQQRHEEALAVADEAMAADPCNPFGRVFKGNSLEASNRREEARAEYRAAIVMDVDCGPAIQALLSSSDSLKQTMDDLELVRGELVRQTIYGDGLLNYYNHATGILPPDRLLESLNAAWKKRPDLWHAWSALVWQLMDMNRLDEALERITQACGRFPFLPQVWLDRAKVCRARMNVEEEIAALRSAVEINPGWSRATVPLAELLSREQRPAEAREVMERAVRHAGSDPANRSELADLLWEEGEKDRAIEEVCRAIRIAPDFGRAWGCLDTWSQELGRRDLLVGLARELAEKRSCDHLNWLNLARSLSSESDPGEKLDAISKALEIEPRSTDAHDLKATTLAEMGDYDGALKACAPRAFPEGPPAQLRATAAWVEARRGNLARAVQMMNAVVKERPDYQWAWQQLADWHQATGNREGYERVCSRLAELDPHNPMPLVYRSEARLAAGDRAGAKADLGRALALAPTYAYAGFSLFDLHVDDDELGEAEKVLATLKGSVNDGFTAVRSVELRIRQDRLPEAIKEFRGVCVREDTAAGAFRGACELIERAAGSGELLALLQRALREKSPCPETSAVLVEKMCAKFEFDECRKLVDGLQGRRGLWHRAVAVYIEGLGGNGRRKELEDLVEEQREALRRDDGCWGSVGYALSTLNRPASAISWMSDWRERRGAAPWMLSNLSTSLRDLGRVEDAREVERFAISLPRDHCTDGFIVWLAYDEVMAGRTEAAAEWMSQVNAPELTAYYKFLKAFIDAVIEIRSVRRAGVKAVFARMKKTLARKLRRGAEYLGDKLSRRVVERCLEEIVSVRGGWLARWWLVWQKLDWPG